MSDKTARNLFGVWLVLAGVVLALGWCSIPADAQWIDESTEDFGPSFTDEALQITQEYDTVWFGDGYMNVHLSPGQLPPYIINISDLEYIEGIYVDGEELQIERIDPLASFIGGIFIGMAVLFLLVGI